MPEVSRLWVPESSSNQAVKLECLKIAAGKAAADCGAVLLDAKAMYDWVTQSQRAA